MITLKHRFKPYTLRPGSRLPIPGSLLYAEVFPSLCRIFSQDHKLIHEKVISIAGPLKRFTVFQDLHRGGLAVFSEQYKYYVLPSGEIVSSVKGALPSADSAAPLLSLGVNKAQEWERIRIRRDMKEILPLWFRLAALTPEEKGKGLLDLGMHRLLADLQDRVENRKKTEICDALSRLWLAGFSTHFLPRLYDTEYQGIIPDLPKDAPVPFYLLRYSLPIIQEIFVRVQEDAVYILPTLPPEFPCGRLLHLTLPEVGELSLEWSKKTIRRVILHAHVSKNIKLYFSRVRGFSCRLRVGGVGCGDILRGVLNTSMSVSAGVMYELSRFEFEGVSRDG